MVIRTEVSFISTLDLIFFNFMEIKLPNILQSFYVICFHKMYSQVLIFKDNFSIVYLIVISTLNRQHLERNNVVYPKRQIIAYLLVFSLTTLIALYFLYSEIKKLWQKTYKILNGNIFFSIQI